MDGRGTGAEDTIKRANMLQKQLSNGEETAEDLTDRLDYEGEMSTTVPEQFDIENGAEKPDIEQDNRTLSDPDKVTALEVEYRTLFGEGGFEILRELEDDTRQYDPRDMGSEGYEDTLDLMEFHGFIETGEGVEITQRGQTTYRNWDGFRQHLSSKDRIDTIEEEIGDTKMPEFLENQGIGTSFDSYFRNPGNEKAKWQRQHDQDAEFYDVTQVLYSDDLEDIGESLVMLENLDEGEIEPTEQHQTVGIRGITDGETLNSEGESLYGRVRADYLNLH